MFYVYEHWRTDTNCCFYVGKGQGRRAWNMRNRSPRHHAMQQWLQEIGAVIEIRVIARDMVEAEAFELECQLIASYGRVALINQTDGGDGMSGYRCPDAVKLAVSKARKGKPLSAEHRAKLAAAKRGKKQKPEHVAKRTAHLYGNTWNVGRMPSNRARELSSQRSKGNKYAAGRSRSAEHKAAISAAHKGQKRSPEWRAKMVLAQQARRQKEAAHASSDA